jgi:drug/metabolite transporter superfamily protein YnfA
VCVCLGLYAVLVFPRFLRAVKCAVALWLVIDPCVNFGRVYCDFGIYIFNSSIFETPDDG